jgi:hypothetical protein
MYEIFCPDLNDDATKCGLSKSANFSVDVEHQSTDRRTLF